MAMGEVKTGREEGRKKREGEKEETNPPTSKQDRTDRQTFSGELFSVSAKVGMCGAKVA